jgi:hypothetical protein
LSSPTAQAERPVSWLYAAALFSSAFGSGDFNAEPCSAEHAQASFRLKPFVSARHNFFQKVKLPSVLVSGAVILFTSAPMFLPMETSVFQPSTDY